MVARSFLPPTPPRLSPRPPLIRSRSMHAWHDIYIDDALIEKTFPVVVEVPMGSKNKYELDKETGFLRLDRVCTARSTIRPTTASFPARSATTAIRWTPWCWGRSRSIR